MRFIGIDPGKKGGIAWTDSSGNCGVVPIEHHTEREIYQELCAIENGSPAVVLLEKVQSTPNDGHVGAFRFGYNAGMLHAMVIASGYRLQFRTPQQWQRGFGLLKRKGETITQKKNRHKAKAQELYPGLRVTHAVADALLISTFCRQNADDLF